MGCFGLLHQGQGGHQACRVLGMSCLYPQLTVTLAGCTKTALVGQVVTIGGQPLAQFLHHRVKKELWLGKARLTGTWFITASF